MDESILFDSPVVCFGRTYGLLKLVAVTGRAERKRQWGAILEASTSLGIRQLSVRSQCLL